MKPVITRHFAVLFGRQGVRTALRHPVLLTLNVLSIALGVAVFLAIQIANRSANESFRAGIEMVAGRANVEVRGRIDEAVLPLMRAVPGVREATPVVEGIVTIPERRGEYLRVMGFDPFSGRELRTFELLGAGRADFDLAAWLREPRAIAVSGRFDRELKPVLGHGEVPVLVDGAVTSLRPTFVIEPEDAAAWSDPRTVAMDIGWAQELLGRAGELSAILLLVDETELEAVTAAVRELVPVDVSVGPPARRGDQVESMLGAFQLNLTALSMVSVLVGTFLIYNTMSASVVRRRTEIGTLRALGASRLEVRGLFLLEAVVAGVLGTALGIALALPLASVVSAPVAQTISSLYVAMSISELFLSPREMVFAGIVGIGASLVAAWVPASEAANCDPARALRPGSLVDHAEEVPRRWLVWGLVGLGLGAAAGVAALQFRVAPLGFVSAFFVLAGFSLLVPASIERVARGLRGAPGFLRMAAQNLGRANHRNSVTIAALAAAIAMTVGISVMIHSFRGSVDRWIGATLVADLFIGSAANEVASVQSNLPDGAVEWVSGQPGVAGVSTFSELPVDFRGERTALAVGGGGQLDVTQFVGGDRAGKVAAMRSADSVAVSEPFANRFNVRAGDTIELATPKGERRFAVAGVYQDYARNGGVILMTAENFARHWPAVAVQSLSATLEQGASAESVGQAFRERFGDEGQFSVYSNVALRGRIFEIFDQTFAVTLVLRSIAVIVAAAGVMLAMVILTAEREREIGILRAVGGSGGQVVGLFLREAALIGMIASIIGVASGACLAVVLTFVVNKAYFGWTIELAYPTGLLLATPLWIVPVAVLAAILPAWRASQVRPAVALRFE